MSETLILLKPLESMYTNGSITLHSWNSDNISMPIVDPTWLETKNRKKDEYAFGLE